jgi:hypothetical protein
LLPPVNRQNCKARSGGICVFARDFFCKYVHVNDPFTNSSHCVFWFTIDERLLLQKTLFGMVYIPPDNSIYSNIDMFNDKENTRTPPKTGARTSAPEEMDTPYLSTDSV